MRCLPGLLFPLLTVGTLSGCATPPAPAPVPPPAVQARPRAAPLDWFQRQMAAARAARRDYRPAGDRVGAQLAYDNIVRAACESVAISGPDKYKTRCNALLRPAPDPASADPFRCDEPTEDPDALRACND